LPRQRGWGGFYRSEAADLKRPVKRQGFAPDPDQGALPHTRELMVV